MTSNNPCNVPTVQPILAMSIAGTTVIGMLALTLPFVRLPTAKQGLQLPYMATPSNKIQKALYFLQQRTQQQQQQQQQQPERKHRVFVDMGSGDGEGVYQATQLLDTMSFTKKSMEYQNNNNNNNHYYYQSCMGVELNRTLCLISHLRRWFFWRQDQRSRSSFVCCDFWTLSVHHADTILIFGIKPLMRPLSIKLQMDNIKPGTHILAYRFPLPVIDNNDTINNYDDQQLLRAKLIYNESEMRIYECSASAKHKQV